MPAKQSLKAEITIGKNDVVIIKGPAVFECNGDASILGKVAGQRKTTIRGDIQVPVETESECNIPVYSAQSVQVADKNVIGTSIWNKPVQQILGKMPRSVVIVGQNDTGKSTFSVYLANKLIEADERIVLLDTDVGQGDLAPPGCIGGVYRSRQFMSERFVRPHRWGFIGKTSPYEVEHLLTRTVTRIEKGFSRGIRLINTDGYVDADGPGFEYKKRLIEVMNPDSICVMGNPEMYRSFGDVFGDRVHFVPAPDIPLRSPSMRRTKRMKQFRRFLRRTESRTIHFNDVHLWYKGRFYNVDDIPGPLIHRFVGLVATNEHELQISKHSIVCIERRREEIGIGVIRSVDEERHTATIQTPYTGDFNTILFGSLKFDLNLLREENVDDSV